MPQELGRREFVKKTALLGAALPLIAAGHPERVGMVSPKVEPVAIGSKNGLGATRKAVQLIKSGADTLDAVIAGVNLVENDPEDTSVGYGGLPNEVGVVELDSCVMHGPTCRGGAVASIQNIKNPSSVAKIVMERTDHVLIVGAGALEFAKAHGFKEENLLTDRAREIWLKWKENLSPGDDWLPKHSIEDKDVGYNLRDSLEAHGTINCLAINTRGDISGVTTTSGLAFKIPGRVGDSPILGAGLFVDNLVGAAGSTGRGEANLLNCSSVMIVEYMRMGSSPEEACLKACQRIVDHTKERRLLNESGRPAFNVKFYALNKKGEHGCASIWDGTEYAVNSGQDSKLMKGAYLFKKE